MEIKLDTESVFWLTGILIGYYRFGGKKSQLYGVITAGKELWTRVLGASDSSSEVDIGPVNMILSKEVSIITESIKYHIESDLSSCTLSLRQEQVLHLQKMLVEYRKNLINNGVIELLGDEAKNELSRLRRTIDEIEKSLTVVERKP